MNSPDSKSDFERQAQTKPPSFVAEFVDFLFNNKKWWLAPILIALLLLSVFIVLTNNVIMPFIYVLF